jgi:DNA ligase 1
LEVGRAVLPMLAATATSVTAAVETLGEVSVEWKLDGARVQIHRSGEQVKVFTRNLNDITARLPQVVDAVLAMPLDNCVLDGEVLGLDPDGRPRIFQDTMSRFGSDTPGAAITLRPYVFDIVHLDGRDLLDEPLAVRQAHLDTVAADWRLPTLVTSDPFAAEAFGAEALAAGHEGVMVKAIGSSYDAGRRGSQWLKVKPVRTLDLVVIAAEWGHGRRRGWLSNLHLAARGADGEFVMVGKTFKGMTDELLRWQTVELQQRAVTSGDWVVQVRPELVVEIALDGVQISRRYPGGVALRFARVRGYRPDRDPATADSIDTVRAMLAGVDVNADAEAADG